MEIDKTQDHPAWNRPILYTDIIANQQARRDDLWAISSRELTALLSISCRATTNGREIMEEFSRELPDLSGAAVRDNTCDQATTDAGINWQGAAVRGEAVAEQAGWKLVPVEATWEMTRPAFSFDVWRVRCNCGQEHSGGLSHNKAAQLFKSMADAAPVSARAADAPSEPSEKKAAAWIDQFGNVFPLGAYQPSGKPSYLDADKRGWKPLFRAADALDSQPTDPYPLLRAAFTTAESGPDGYFVKFKFPTLAAMQAAQMQWCLDSRASAAPVTAIAPPVHPTKEMIASGMRWLSNFQRMRKADKENALSEAYFAMLAAAPQQEGSESDNG